MTMVKQSKRGFSFVTPEYRAVRLLNSSSALGYKHVLILGLNQSWDQNSDKKITVADKTQTSGKTLIIVTENIKIHKNLN